MRISAVLPESGTSGIQRRVGWVLLLLSATLLVACDGLPIDPRPGKPEGPQLGGVEDEVARLVNDYRQQQGCPRLAWDGALANVARGHAQDMKDGEYFGHVSRDGATLKERLALAEISFLRAAENIARGYRYERAAQAVVQGWIASDSHREIILDCRYRSHGIGFVDFHWSQVFIY